MPHRLKLAGEPLRAGAAFHADYGTIGSFKEDQRRLAPELRPLNHAAGRIGAHDVERFLAEIDAIHGRAEWLTMPQSAARGRGGPSHYFLSPALRRACVEQVRTQLHVSERRACAALGQHRSTLRKLPRGRDDEARLTADTIALARQYGRYGYRKFTGWCSVRRDGWKPPGAVATSGRSEPPPCAVNGLQANLDR